MCINYTGTVSDNTDDNNTNGALHELGALHDNLGTMPLQSWYSAPSLISFARIYLVLRDPKDGTLAYLRVGRVKTGRVHRGCQRHGQLLRGPYAFHHCHGLRQQTVVRLLE